VPSSLPVTFGKAKAWNFIAGARSSGGIGWMQYPIMLYAGVMKQIVEEGELSDNMFLHCLPTRSPLI